MTKLAEQRAGLPDQPGVYLFRDARGRVIYVGKAKSIRKRVASHFSARGPLLEFIDNIEYLVVETEAEALLAEQNFIRQYKPRFNIRLRDDKSYPYIAISLDEDYPRVYFTRERHRKERAYFGPYSSAKRVRGTLDLLGKIFLFRSCEGPEPGRRSGSPCLDYYIKRCGAPCVGYVSKEEYRAGIDGVIAFLSGRFRQIERELEDRMFFASGQQDYEQATIERNRLQAVRALLERQRVADDRAGTYDAVAVAVDATEANAQVFQVRDGVLSDRQSLLPRQRGRVRRRARERGVPAPVLRERDVDPGADRRAGRARRRLRARGAGRDARRAPQTARSRSAPPSAAASAASSTSPSATRSSRSTRRSCAPSAAASSAWRRSTRCRRRSRLDALPVRVECFDISNIGGTHTVASMVVFEGGAPKKSDYRRFTIRTVEGSDDFASMAEVLARRYAQWEKQAEKLALRRRARRVVRRAAEPRGDRRRPGPAVGRARAAAGLPRPRRRGGLAGQADRGGLLPRPRRAAAARPRHARAAAAPARARRGPPLRHHAPPASAATRR